MGNADNNTGDYYGPLTRRMVLITIFMSVTPLVAITGTILYLFQRSYQDKSLDYLTILVKNHRNQIDTFLSDRLADIGVMARSSGVDWLAYEEFLQQRLSILHGEYGRSFVDLGLVNEDGIQVAYAGPFKLRKANYSEADWFKEAIKKEYYISDVFPGLRGIPHFIVAVRLEHQDRKWILRATVDFDEFNQLVANIRIGSTGFAFILNKDGELQTKGRHRTVTSKSVYLDFLRSNPRLSPAAVGVVETTDEKGVRFLHIMSPMKNNDWLLAYQQNARDAYSVIYDVQKIALGIFLVGVVGIVAAAVIISRRMVNHIEVADHEKNAMNDQVIEAGKLASVGELAAGVAHEINNPVAIMVEEAGWIGDLLDDEEEGKAEDRAELRRALNQIITQGKRCKEITFKLLSFARKTDAVVKELALNDLIEEVVSLSQQRSKYAGVRLSTELQADLPSVYASPSEIQQVVLNLINNALDALEQKGGNVCVSTRSEGSNLTIDVSDDGPGIPRSNLYRIFNPFFTTKPPGKGTGLGLSICYGIIKKMGGELSVESELGVGTTFHVSIPLPVEKKEERRHGSTVASAPGPTNHEESTKESEHV